jgi:hypothetical protein
MIAIVAYLVLLALILMVNLPDLTVGASVLSAEMIASGTAT